MKLKNFLAVEGLSETKFADELGISQAAVNRYCWGRVPTPDIMKRIVAYTEGRVTPTDFFEMPAASERRAS